MKYLKKFNESTSDFENDVNYIMSELIHEYDFRKYDVPFIGYAGRGGNSVKEYDEVHYYTEYISVSEEFNENRLYSCLVSRCTTNHASSTCVASERNRTFIFYLEGRSNEPLYDTRDFTSGWTGLMFSFILSE